jgi:hypothetical protein
MVGSEMLEQLHFNPGRSSHPYSATRGSNPGAIRANHTRPCRAANGIRSGLPAGDAAFVPRPHTAFSTAKAAANAMSLADSLRISRASFAPSDGNRATRQEGDCESRPTPEIGHSSGKQLSIKNSQGDCHGGFEGQSGDRNGRRHSRQRLLAMAGPPRLVIGNGTPPRTRRSRH